MKWVKNLESVPKVQTLATFLAEQDRCLQEAADKIFFLQTQTLHSAKYELPPNFNSRSRAAVYDVPTSIDLLTTGTYPRLPTSIEVDLLHSVVI